MEKEFIPTYMEALSILHRCPFYTINPCEGEFKPIRGIYNRYKTNNMTIAQQLKITKFPFIIKDDTGKEIYHEMSDGWWCKHEYDDKGNMVHWENSFGYWEKREWDDKGKEEIYYGNSHGIVVDKRPKPLPEYTMEELVDKLGHNFKIKK